jgi:hypothetical protein
MKTNNGGESNSLAVRQKPRYYCRGCGKPFPAGVLAHFHKECLRIDKRERTRERRRKEQEMVQRSLDKLRCSNCGAAYCD